MAKFTVTCRGTSPLIMHNARLVDPLDPIVKQIKEVSSKTRKTDADHATMAQLEWLGGIYYHASVGPFIPAPNLLKCIIEGARLTKDGKKVERGVLIESMMIPVEYDGPRDPEALYGDRRFIHRAPVKVGMARVMRTRPIFTDWQLTAVGIYDETVINAANLHAAAESAGSMIGLGDGRPMFGRFICKFGSDI